MTYANSPASAGTVFANSDRYWEDRRTERNNVTDRGLDNSLIITSEDYISSQCRLGRLWTHGILTTVGGEKALESCWSCIVSVSTMDSSAEDLRPCAFTVPNKNRNATAFISVSQCARTTENMNVWKPKPAVAWMCQVQTSLCVLSKEWSTSRNNTEKLYGGAISLNGVWEAAMYTTVSAIVLALSSPYFPRSVLHPSAA